MTTIADSARLVLEPYVGGMVADTCVRATALSVGKTTDTLSADDLDALSANIRRLLAPVAPLATIDGLVGDLRRQVSA